MTIPALQAHGRGQERRPRASEFAHFSSFACEVFVIYLSLGFVSTCSGGSAWHGGGVKQGLARCDAGYGSRIK